MAISLRNAINKIMQQIEPDTFSSRNNIPPPINQSNATDFRYRNHPGALPRTELFMPFRQFNYYLVEKRRGMTCHDHVNSPFKFNRINQSYRQTKRTRHGVSLRNAFKLY